MFNELYSEHFDRFPSMDSIKNDLEAACDLLLGAVLNDRVIFTCGNGGSAADAEHIVGELLKSFRIPRPLNSSLLDKINNIQDKSIREGFTQNLEGGIRSICLMGHPSFASAYANDRDGDYTVAQKLSVLGNEGDVVILISTSGNSRNIVLAGELAKVLGIKTIAMTGEKDSKLSEICDITLKMPDQEVFRVQEMHLPVYHFLCAYLERKKFS